MFQGLEHTAIASPDPKRLAEWYVQNLEFRIVDDFDAAMQELRSRGIEFLTQPTAMQGNRLIFFSDADGNYLHLIQRPQPLP